MDELGAVYYAGVSLLKEEGMARSLRTAMVWFGFALSVEAILQAYLSPGKVYGLFPSGYHDFVMGPIVYHTHFAAFIEVLLPISLFLALSETRRRYTMLGVSAVFLTALVVSASRGGLVIAGAEVIAILILSHFRKSSGSPRITLLALLLVGLTDVLTVIVGFETASQRFSTEPLSAGRLQFAMSTLHMIARHPWVGWGLGCWPSVYPAFATFDPGAIVNQAHCDWLQWIAEGWPAAWHCHAFDCSVGGKTGATVDLGNRRDRSLRSCRVRLSVFTSGSRRLAHSDAGYGSNCSAKGSIKCINSGLRFK